MPPNGNGTNQPPAISGPGGNQGTPGALPNPAMGNLSQIVQQFRGSSPARV
jgi:hypothetical protein